MRALASMVAAGAAMVVVAGAAGDEGTARAPAAAGSVAGDCASCHPAEWQEWSASRHAAAWVDPVFQAEFARGRPAWCVSCHAPAVADPTAPDPASADQGVGCAGCHRRDGRMVSTRRGERSPHDTAPDPSFGSPDFCASCHEFNFPVLGEGGQLVRYTGEPMQATVSQWRASRVSREVDCAGCHGASPAGHAFRGSHDPELVARSIDVRLCRAGGSAIEVSLGNRGAGHNVPSGGVHRRMVLRAWTSNAPERLAERTLGRRFRPLAGGGKQTLSDTTLAPGAVQRHRFALAALGRGQVNLELRYVYALDEHADLPGDVSRVVWSGRIDPPALARCSPTSGSPTGSRLRRSRSISARVGE